MAVCYTYRSSETNVELVAEGFIYLFIYFLHQTPWVIDGTSLFLVVLSALLKHTHIKKISLPLPTNTQKDEKSLTHF